MKASRLLFNIVLVFLLAACAPDRTPVPSPPGRGEDSSGAEAGAREAEDAGSSVSVSVADREIEPTLAAMDAPENTGFEFGSTGIGKITGVNVVNFESSDSVWIEIVEELSEAVEQTSMLPWEETQIYALKLVGKEGGGDQDGGRYLFFSNVKDIDGVVDAYIGFGFDEENQLIIPANAQGQLGRIFKLGDGMIDSEGKYVLGIQSSETEIDPVVIEIDLETGRTVLNIMFAEGGQVELDNLAAPENQSAETVGKVMASLMGVPAPTLELMVDIQQEGTRFSIVDESWVVIDAKGNVLWQPEVGEDGVWGWVKKEVGAPVEAEVGAVVSNQVRAEASIALVENILAQIPKEVTFDFRGKNGNYEMVWVPGWWGEKHDWIGSWRWVGEIEAAGRQNEMDLNLESIPGPVLPGMTNSEGEDIVLVPNAETGEMEQVVVPMMTIPTPEGNIEMRLVDLLMMEPAELNKLILENVITQADTPEWALENIKNHFSFPLPVYILEGYSDNNNDWVYNVVVDGGSNSNGLPAGETAAIVPMPTNVALVPLFDASTREVWGWQVVNLAMSIENYSINFSINPADSDESDSFSFNRFDNWVLSGGELTFGAENGQVGVALMGETAEKSFGLEPTKPLLKENESIGGEAYLYELIESMRAGASRERFNLKLIRD